MPEVLDEEPGEHRRELRLGGIVFAGGRAPLQSGPSLSSAAPRSARHLRAEPWPRAREALGAEVRRPCRGSASTPRGLKVDSIETPSGYSR